MTDIEHYQKMLRLFRAAQVRAIRSGNSRMADLWAKNIAKVKDRVRQIENEVKG